MLKFNLQQKESNQFSYSLWCQFEIMKWLIVLVKNLI